MKLSLYEFRDLCRVYGIVELTVKETKVIFDLFKNREKLFLYIKGVFNEIETIKYSIGWMFRGGEEFEFIYLSVEYEDNGVFTLEVHPGWMTLLSNEPIRKAFFIAKRFFNGINGLSFPCEFSVFT